MTVGKEMKVFGMPMEQIQILHFGLTLVFSGFILYALMQSLFMYIRVPGKETVALMALCVVSFFYMAADVLSFVFTLVLKRDAAAYFFVSLRELTPLLFLIVFPYYLDHVLEFKGRLKSINRFSLLIGIAIGLGIAASVAVNPDLLVKYGAAGPGIGGIAAHQKGPLIVIRNLVILAYLVYVITAILITAIRRETGFPGKNVLAGLVILSYFAFTGVYSLLFAPDGAVATYRDFPYIGLGIAILILFMGFGVMDLFVDFFGRLKHATDDYRSELYYDAEMETRNRIGFRKDLKSELDAAAGTGSGFYLVSFDVDDFQNINELYGEGFGDSLLKMLARRLREAFPGKGTLYRIGGDEFAFILEGIKDDGEAGTFAAEIMSSLKNPFAVSGIPCTLTVSIAILRAPRDGGDVNTIMRNAYATIRSVKKTKNSFEFFDGKLLEGASGKIRAVDLLRNCISRGEFYMVYQPVVDAGGTIRYAEALVRCSNTDPTIGGPDKFIPLIEKAGMMKDLDNLVVRASFYDIEMKMKKRFAVSINMSAAQLVDQSYGDFLSLFAKQHGIEPRNIILEITENNLVENMNLARESLSELKKNGFAVAIDDFGKGFSSLSYLAELPVDIIKIDKAFVDSVPGDPKKETMARYIMDLGHSLNLKVVAEGFEQPEQVEFFKGLGCDLYQGYYFSRPLRLQDLMGKY